MAQYRERLSKEEVGKIFYQLCVAIAGTKDPAEAAELLRDLLSPQEAQMIAKRLKIAELLEDGLTYRDIRKATKASDGTVARIHEWLKVSGEGYRSAIRRVGKTDKKHQEPKNWTEPGSWRSLKKRYPMYYWPEILLEELVVQANNRQREKLNRVLGQMDKMEEKTELYHQLKKLLKPRNPNKN